MLLMGLEVRSNVGRVEVAGAILPEESEAGMPIAPFFAFTTLSQLHTPPVPSPSTVRSRTAETSHLLAMPTKKRTERIKASTTATPSTTPNTRQSANKFDPSEQYRGEIEQRTAAGETCEQIASALRAQGHDITNKTISRRRLEWGLRRRPPHKYAGMKHPKQRPRKEGTSVARKEERKAEIEARTARGESAAHIAAALQADGMVLTKGASTILRLQTYWGLIPYDESRARGRYAKKKEVREQEKVSQREREKEANRAQREGNLHYPADCAFGPKKRANGAGGVDEDGESNDADGDMDDGIMPGFMDVSMVSPVGVARPAQDGISVAAEIMSVDFLVDLANSTLEAANNLKALLLAHQSGAPTAETMLPPTIEDLSMARRKVREAAAVMHDLAVDPTGT